MQCRNNLPGAMNSGHRMRLQKRAVSFHSATWEEVTSPRRPTHSRSILVVYTIQCRWHATHTTMPHGAARPVVRSQAGVLEKMPSCCAAARYAPSDREKRNDLPPCARPARARQAAGRRGFDLLAVPRSPRRYRSDVTMTSWWRSAWRWSRGRDVYPLVA